MQIYLTMKVNKEKKCKECGNSFTPYLSTNKYCSSHCYYKSDEHKKAEEKKAAKNLSAPKKVYVKKPTGEKIVFEQIWNTRPHKSQISGEPIYDAQPHNFMHILAKGQNKYPKFILLKENIVLATYEEHFLWDNMRYKIINDEKWQWVFEKEKELKERYKKINQTN